MKKFGWAKRVVLVSAVLSVLGSRLVFAGDLGGANAYSREDYETDIHGGVMEASEAYTRKDYVTALKLYRPLAEQGNAVAQHNLGLMYSLGAGVPQDCEAALKWYRKSAERGYDTAMNSLGLMYAVGNCVPQDDVLAYALFNIASADNPLSRGMRSNISERMSRSQIDEGQAITKQLVRPGEFLKALDAAARRSPSPVH